MNETNGNATLLVKMADMAVAKNGMRLKTTLGSCVGLIIHDPMRKQSALAHIMLPERVRGDAAVAKYADTAIPALLAELQRRGSKREHLEAYVTGGAEMFGGSHDGAISAVGPKNVRAARAILAGLDIKIVYEHTGGTRGRTVVFSSDSAEIEVKTIQPCFGTGRSA